MAQTIVHVRREPGASVALGQAGEHSLSIDRSKRGGGAGMGFSPGQLLQLAIGACYYVGLHREAAKRSLVLTQVAVDVAADWGGSPARLQQLSCTVTVEAEASEAEILDLIRHADQTGEIIDVLRTGASVVLGEARAVTRSPDEPAIRADAVLEMLGTAGGPGATCALLTPAIKARLRELTGGQVLEVRVDDPAAREDIAAWCRLAGHELLAVQDTPDYTRYFLSKKLN